LLFLLLLYLYYDFLASLVFRNMTRMEANISLPFKRKELDLDIPIMCITVGEIAKSLSGMFGNATGGTTTTDGNTTNQMLMEMMKQQMMTPGDNFGMGNMTKQDSKEVMDFVACSPVMDENTTQSMMVGSMMR
jgi:hypothetical protein